MSHVYSCAWPHLIPVNQELDKLHVVFRVRRELRVTIVRGTYDQHNLKGSCHIGYSRAWYPGSGCVYSCKVLSGGCGLICEARQATRGNDK
jgi:hypothetical protein